MKMMYSFYDEKACFFLPPVVIENFASLSRSLRSAASENMDAPFVRYPSDFVIYEVGSFDELTGVVSGVSPPTRVATMAEVLAQLST